MTRKFLLTWAVGGLTAALSAADLVLATRGEKPSFTIVTRGTVAANVDYAAQTLQDWTKRLTGVELPRQTAAAFAGGPAITLEQVADPALGDDGFRLQAVPTGLAITGGRRGLLYGVNELLETYGGILWLSPETTHVPKTGVLKVPADLDVSERPAFESRSLDTFDCWGCPVFGARLRLNKSTASEIYGSWYPPFDRVLGPCHTFLKLVPPEKYAKDHPEYYSLVKGKRTTSHQQLCLTNPDVFQIVLSNVLARIAANKAEKAEWRRMTKYYGISQDDWNNYCECEQCAAIDAREESHAGSVIWFLNKLAEEVEKRHPDVMLETLAYMYSRKPPKYLRPRHNVAIFLCTIECDFSKPMAESRYSENADFRENVLKWRDMSSELFLWDYAANWRATPAPYPNLDAYAANIPYFHGLGIRHLFEEGINSPSANFTDLKGWLGAKLMWNPKRDAKALVRQFCAGYYGKAAPKVLEFIDLMQRQPWDELKVPLKYAVNIEDMTYAEQFLVEGDRLWREAEELAQADEPQILKNVQWGRFGLRYARAAQYAQKGAWRALILSPAVRAQLDEAVFNARREDARYCQALLAKCPTAMVSSRLNDTRLKGYLKALATAEFPSANADKAVLQDWAIGYSDFPKSKTTSRVDDKDATDGRAILIENEKGSWKATCGLDITAVFEKGRRYRLRGRIKLMPDAQANPKVGLILVGLFDRTTKKDPTAKPVLPAAATGRYEWYDFGEWTDEGHPLILHVDLRGATCAIDCFEISAVGGDK